jgi:type IV pilus assembly protein PilC
MKIKLIDKITFLQNLAVMVKSGIPIIDALDVINEDVDNKNFHLFIKKMIINLQKGQSVYSSLKNDKDFLSSAHLGILEAGEISGQLYESLLRIKDDLQKEYNLVQKVKGALSYPAIIFLALIGIGGGIITFVLPKIADVFTRMNVKLPLPTKILINVGSFINHNLILVFVGMMAIGAVLAVFFRTLSGKKALSWVIAHTPMVNGLVRDITFTRFTRTLSVMIKSGVSIDQGLEIGSKVFPITVAKIVSQDLADNVRKGQTLSSAMKKHKKTFPGILIRMISVGESTGTLGEILNDISDYFERRVDSNLTILTNMLEPLMMLTVGLAIGGAVLSIIGPIYGMVGSMQQSSF